MADKNQTPKHFTEMLREGEKIIHSHSPEKKSNALNLGILIFFILSIIICAIFISGIAATVISSVFFFWIFINIIAASNRAKDYAITTDRILIGDNPAVLQVIPFNKIYDLHVESGFISFINNFPFNTTPNGIGQYPKIQTHISPYTIKKDILEHWSKKSAYQTINNRFEKLANKYGLDFHPFHYKNNKGIKMTGKINQQSFSFHFQILNSFKELEITTTCINEENNFLFIRPEGFGDGMAKKVGMQDEEIGDRLFDSKFILQSDNSKFLNAILDKETKPLIRAGMKYINGRISFGESLSKNKKKITTDIYEHDILDAHLLGEEKEKRDRTPGLTSLLVYKSKNMEHLQNPNMVLNHVEMILEMMVNLSTKLKEYNNK